MSFIDSGKKNLAMPIDGIKPPILRCSAVKKSDMRKLNRSRKEKCQ
jgi:hypothetical protein